MKRFFLWVIFGVVSFVLGFALAMFIRNVADDLPQYSPDELAKWILNNGSVVGKSYDDGVPMGYLKPYVATFFETDTTKFERYIFKNKRYTVLLTIANDVVAEAEIWRSGTNDSMFYEANPERLREYYQNHPDKPLK